MTMQALIVDDSSVSQMLAKALLERAGWQVLVCSTAEQALTQLENQIACDLLLCDISLPGASGTDLMAQLQSKGKKPAHCIAYTAHSMPHEMAAIQAAGFDQILNKPINPAQLQHLLEAINHE